MSLETKVSELIDLETKNLKKYTDEYDKRTAFIEGKGKEVDDFINDGRGTYLDIVNSTKSIFVAGDRTKFYPVVLPILVRKGINKLNIYRGYYHEDKNVADINGSANPPHNTGNMEAEFLVKFDHWPNGGDWIKQTVNTATMNTFVAGWRGDPYPIGAFVVWLRGNHTYYIKSDLIDMESYELGEYHVPTVDSYTNATYNTASDVPLYSAGGKSQRCKDGSVAVRQSYGDTARDIDVLAEIQDYIPSSPYIYNL